MVFPGPQERGWLLGVPQQGQRERGVVTVTVASFASDYRVKEVVWLNLEVLSESPLATATEAELIQGLAESDETADNEDDPPEGQQ